MVYAMRNLWVMQHKLKVQHVVGHGLVFVRNACASPCCGITLYATVCLILYVADDTRRAKWATEGLPIDPLSVENGAIMTNAWRWPLMIDPQLQVCMRR